MTESPPTDLDLPPIHDVLLDDDIVAQLFFDIEHAATLLGVTLKEHGDARAAGERLDLTAARIAFTTRAVASVQLRYVHQGSQWWDTLTHTPAGVRLIRINHSQALAMSPP
ncbi:MAG: hypothetical protein R3B06_14135 [Kofleriaceae bacterium]